MNKDGGLTYGGIYLTRANGRAKFNHVELYGGRTSFIEFVTDLDGNEQVIDLQKLPIATTERLGYVLIGKNIDVDEEGTISLPRDYFTPITDLRRRLRL